MQKKRLIITAKVVSPCERGYKSEQLLCHPLSFPACALELFVAVLLAGGNLFKGLCMESLITRLAASITSSNLQRLYTAFPRWF